ncbi:hypothetical protein B7C42_01600 [Nocardia cerradoensis]|uniref:Uncharacterized protein n=1 Tax=Nocardia cerradoensis TaxID=85688 RepID=A0A231HCV4_9NOCA|nr:hypothetical protein [Nocardia cerradoensis]OXR46626.1 hypothetical protein B7C42_01600 [Nocardia cerradoensis]
MGRHSDSRRHQAADDRVSVAALTMRETYPSEQPLMITSGTSKEITLEPAGPWSEWIHPDVWLQQHSGPVVS